MCHMPGWEGSVEHESAAVYLRKIQKWLVEEGGRRLLENTGRSLRPCPTTAKAWLMNIN